MWPHSVFITISMMFSHHRQWRPQSSTSSDLCLHQCYTPWVEKKCENQNIQMTLKAISFRFASSTRPASTTTRRPVSSFSWRSWLIFHSPDNSPWYSRSLTGGLQSSDRPSSQVSRPRNYFPDRGPVKSSFLSILLFNRGSFQKRQLNLSFFPFQVSIFLK